MTTCTACGSVTGFTDCEKDICPEDRLRAVQDRAAALHRRHSGRGPVWEELLFALREVSKAAVIERLRPEEATAIRVKLLRLA